jgi:hypothetical protein
MDAQRRHFAVIPNDQGQDLFNEYEVNFGNQVIAIFYETQLRLVDITS